MTTNIPEQDLAGCESAEDKAQQKNKEAAQPAPPPQTEPHLPTTVKSKDAANDEKRYRLEKRRFAVEILTLIVLAVYMCIAYNQWEEMRKATTAATQSADVAKDALYSVQRAFVVYQGNDLAYSFAEPPEINRIVGMEFHPRWENVGTTPAQHGQSGFGVMFSKATMSDGFDFRDTRREISYSFGPKVSVTTTGDAVPLDKIKLAAPPRRGHVYLYGWVAYNDVFTGTSRHITMFCNEVARITEGSWNPTENVITGGTITFIGCKRHNCTDNDCIGEPYGRRGHKWPDAP